MKKIAFGASGLRLSRMGLGLAALGRPGYINLGHSDDLAAGHDVNVMLRQTRKMLSLAHSLGVTYFDVAQSYGKGEEFMADWLKDYYSENVSVGSKWGYYYTAGWQVHAENHEIKEHSIDRLNLQWPESKERLGSALKLYQIHSATFESGVLENIAVLEKLESMRSEGFLIGLSLSGVHQGAVLEKALTVKVGDQPLFGSVQATYNCLETSVSTALQKAADKGLGVIIKEGVANGRLTDRNLKLPAVVKEIANRYEVGPDAVALSYILSKPFVHVVLSGAANEDHLRSNLRADDLELSKMDLAQLDQLTLAPEHYWKERSDLEWN